MCIVKCSRVIQRRLWLLITVPRQKVRAVQQIKKRRHLYKETNDTCERLQHKIDKQYKHDHTPTPTHDTQAIPIATTMLKMVTPKNTTPPPHASPLSPNRPSSQEKAIKPFLGTSQQRNPEGHRACLLALGRQTILPPELQPANTPREHAINAYILDNPGTQPSHVYDIAGHSVMESLVKRLHSQDM